MNQPTIAYFDTVAGISGDMTLGALIDAGLPLDYLRPELRKLNLTGFEVEAKHVEINGITAVKLDVVVSTPDTHHRHFSEIKKLIESSVLAAEVKDTSLSIFYTLAQAEAKIHNVPAEKIHFHEVGAIDSIVDIVGTAIGLAYLGVKAVYSSPVKVGAPSTVKSAHGMIPTPAPATLEILRGYPVVFTDIPGELTTPTGAAIIKTLSRGVLTFESIKFNRIGYGAGTKRFEQLPNVLRIGIGMITSPEKGEEILAVEANIDDMNPELYPHVIEKLLSSGARDAFLTPVIMKKGRPGTMITVLCTPENRDTVINTLLAETTTIGVRYRLMYRKVLKRVEKTVETEFGKIMMKSVEIDGKEYTKPEFEECKRIAEKFNIPLIEVYRRLEKS
jgi:pyridinium-3,5-bisthiocarboxylic acid mononucleotide nickel chelatase